jgi:hypothetical protein
MRVVSASGWVQHNAELVAEDGVGLGCDVWRGGFAGADGPDGFVGDDQMLGLRRGDVVQGGAELGAQDLLGAVLLAFG